MSKNWVEGVGIIFQKDTFHFGLKKLLRRSRYEIEEKSELFVGLR